MHDIPPDQTPLWHFVEEATRQVMAAYGYREIRVPLVEKTELFRRSIGEVTDIVEKEMYSFLDRNNESLTLRPEGTAGVVRACIESGLLRGQSQRLWYLGPMFRHERPQKGRYRQFHQVGVETFGLPGPDIDAELILMTARLWRALGLEDLRLEINSLGTPASRIGYRAHLLEYLAEHRDRLDEDSRRRMETSPLRILDSKDPETQTVVADAPLLLDHLDAESQEHFDELRALLDAAGVAYHINPRLVRGLDYYTRTVFEWITDRLGAQGTICAGGRFDGLVEHLGGRSTPAAGHAIGMERLVSLLQESGAQPPQPLPHAYLVMMGEAAQCHGAALAERLRDALEGLRLVVHCGGGSYKSQFKHADKSGAQSALILGEDELAAGRVSVKDLRGHGEQQSLSELELVEYLKRVQARS